MPPHPMFLLFEKLNGFPSGTDTTFLFHSLVDGRFG